MTGLTDYEREVILEKHIFKAGSGMIYNPDTHRLESGGEYSLKDKINFSYFRAARHAVFGIGAFVCLQRAMLLFQVIKLKAIQKLDYLL
jgi:hypothetical protein